MERVELEPTPIGIVPDEYRGVELVGYRGEAAPDVLTPCELSEEIDKFAGTRGITLIGSTMRENFDTAAEAS